MSDETAIRDVLAQRDRHIHDKDANGLIALYADSAVMFELAPPLAFSHDPKESRGGYLAWFATWSGPIGYETRDLALAVHGELALATLYLRIHGTKSDGTTPDSWFRQTVALRKSREGWRIVHQHTSVPFYMDGSGRAALDLKP